MKAIGYIKGLILILLVLITITIPSRQAYSKFKAPLVTTEFEISDFEVIPFLQSLSFEIPQAPEEDFFSVPEVFETHTTFDPVLSFLYLTHPPPPLS